MDLSKSNIIEVVREKTKDKKFNENLDNQKVNQVTDHKHKTTNIVHNIQEGTAPECLRSVDVNKIIDKCSDLKKMYQTTEKSLRIFTNLEFETYAESIYILLNQIVSSLIKTLIQYGCTNRSGIRASTITKKPKSSFHLI